MRKLFTLIGALLLWQTVAVAQNYLHITSGDSTKIVLMDELDSVTVRDKVYYGGEWEYLTTGTYTYTVLAEGTLEGHQIYVKNMNADGTLRQYQVSDWYFGAPLIIDYDASTHRCRIQPQATGYVHDTHGMIMITDCATYTGDDSYLSVFDEEAGQFQLFVIYYVEAGNFGYDYEYLQLDKQSRAQARNRKAGNAPLTLTDKEPVPFKQAAKSKLNTPVKQTEKRVETKLLKPVSLNPTVK